MKSPHLIFIALLILVGCSSANEEFIPNETITGKWSLQQILTNGVNTFEQCMEQNNFIANDDGSIIIETYRVVNPNTNCIVVINTASWELISDNSYEITYDNNSMKGSIVNDNFIVKTTYTESSNTGVKIIYTSEMIYTRIE